ncbi:hypothetical protein BKA70DRAFT_540820 [Coprinopsis sp. MPI-PUGE-AT-0042]|nr:hypothetical protein BKA70DRAFT_540820 [Coprinopsis sp. MPI-PUGE-AT-0042]
MATIQKTSGALPPPRPNHDFTRKPSSKAGQFFWRWRMWVESTFVLSMLEPWEKLMLVALFVVGFVFVMSAITKYLPQHVNIIGRRAMYYIYGQENDPRSLWQWLGVSSGSEAAGLATATVKAARTAVKAGADL